MQAMIFAAGLGTRLKPLTDTMPKALVKVAERPLLEHVIEKLKGAGCNHVVVNVHHFSEQIKEYLQCHDFGMTIDVSDETEQLLDTGGGIKRAASLFDTSVPVLIHNVDILSNVDLAAFYAKAGKENSAGKIDAVLLVSARTTQRYLIFNEEMRLVGWTNVATGEVKSPDEALRQLAFHAPTAEAPDALQHGYHLYAFAGIHAVGQKVFDTMVEEPEKFPIMDFYLRHCGRLNIHGELAKNLRLIDVGKLDTLHEAEQFAASLSVSPAKESL